MAQERLIELEKVDAPIIEQIRQASLFAGVPFSKIATYYAPVESLGVIQTPSQISTHGRQEYCLRWLLKKFQDEETRQHTAAWRLLRLLMDFIPLRNLARVLNEKEFVLLLRKALEQAVAAADLVDDLSDTVMGSQVKGKCQTSGSKKRRRDCHTSSQGLVNQSAAEGARVTAEWKWAVYEVVDRVVQLSKPGSHSRETSTSEYIKSATRTSSDEAARILGAWLALCGTQTRPSAIEPDGSLLSPFFEIWDSRVIDPEDAKIFSKHCLEPSLIVVSAAGQLPEQKSQLEKLLALNVIVPAKTAYGSSKDADFLISLVGDTVSRNPGFAPILFDITVRCIPSHGSWPRGADDTTWLQAVISALKESMNGGLLEERILALNQTLRYCINHKIALELPLLRLITSHYGLPTGSTNWDLLATIIELDSNVFLIPSNPEDLLEDVLVRITKASTEALWPIIVDQVVDKALTPLMGEFAKARQLTTFIYHWYEQLVEIDKFQRDSHKEIEHFTAWEDEALRVKLKELLEPSLTTLQIVEIIDWLVQKIEDCVGPVCVLLDAVAGAISDTDTRIALRSTLIEKVMNVLVYSGPDDRYKARLLHLNTLVLDWSSWQNFEDTSIADGNSPLFVSLLSSKISFPDRDHSLVALEAFRYLCAHWSIGAPRLLDGIPAAFRSGAGVEALSNYITFVASHIRKLVGQIAEGRTLSEEKWESRVITIKRGMGWLACAYASCILVEYPQVLEYVTPS
jgi:nucleolar pre-ribosomal-associated protein 2